MIHVATIEGDIDPGIRFTDTLRRVAEAIAARSNAGPIPLAEAIAIIASVPPPKQNLSERQPDAGAPEPQAGERCVHCGQISTWTKPALGGVICIDHQSCQIAAAYRDGQVSAYEDAEKLASRGVCIDNHHCGCGLTIEERIRAARDKVKP